MTAGAALGAAAILVLGGTFAWQGISQTTLNEASDLVNPGGRLHSDQNWISAKENNTDIYVENFTDPEYEGDEIFARVRLEEYLEVVVNYGVDGAETVETIAGSKTSAEDAEGTGATKQNEYAYTYEIHKFGESNKTDGFVEWIEADADSERPWYLPTFNLNKDSLLADLNGTYVDTIGGISNRGESQYEYEEIGETSSKTATEVYDGDTNALDELDRDMLLDLIANGEDAASYETISEHIVLAADQEHTSRQVGTTNGLISMNDWLTMSENGEETGRYWVYDTDGWIYWSSPIEAGGSTGLLLDGFTMNHVMDDSWYYAIHAVAQFVTADDAGKEDGTGFYDTEAGAVPSENAEKLMEKIGIGAESEEDTTPVLKLYNSNNASAGTPFVMSADPSVDHTWKIETLSGSIPAEDSFFLMPSSGGDLVSGTDYTYEDGRLTITATHETAEQLNAYGTKIMFISGAEMGIIIWEDDGELTLSSDADDATAASVGSGVTLHMAADGAAPENIKVYKDGSLSTELESESYTYENGILTITDPQYAGRCMFIVSASVNDGWIYLQ